MTILTFFVHTRFERESAVNLAPRRTWQPIMSSDHGRKKAAGLEAHAARVSAAASGELCTAVAGRIAATESGALERLIAP